MEKRCGRLVMLVAAACVLGVAGRASAVPLNPVYPGDPSWTLDPRGSSSSAAITGTKPRSGNGSLEFAAAGALTDWAFYYHTVDRLTGSWGNLSDLDTLSFDWLRATGYDTSKDDAPWQAQSPVLRLLLREDHLSGPVFSEIVWEKWYTDITPAAVGGWVEQGLTGQNFWRYVNGVGYTIYDGTNVDPFSPSQPLMTLSPAGWGAYLGDDALVWGIAVGVGSKWPKEYLGFVDNVALGFKGQGALAVSANFELPVPEPSTLLLMGSGLAAAALYARKRRT